jgi:glycogen operon protein
MLLAGDERGHTQQGNNNAYCQDNEITWLDWHSADAALTGFTRRVLALRAAHSVFRRRHFFSGTAADPRDLPDIAWLSDEGHEIAPAQWADPGLHHLAVFLNGDLAPRRGRHGEHLRSGTFLVLLNAHWTPVAFRVPPSRYGDAWRVVLDTSDDDAPTTLLTPGAGVDVIARCLVLLQRVTTDDADPSNHPEDIHA